MTITQKFSNLKNCVSMKNLFAFLIIAGAVITSCTKCPEVVQEVPETLPQKTVMAKLISTLGLSEAPFYTSVIKADKRKGFIDQLIDASINEKYTVFVWGAGAFEKGKVSQIDDKLLVTNVATNDTVVLWENFQKTKEDEYPQIHSLSFYEDLAMDDATAEVTTHVKGVMLVESMVVIDPETGDALGNREKALFAIAFDDSIDGNYFMLGN